MEHLFHLCQLNIFRIPPNSFARRSALKTHLHQIGCSDPTIGRKFTKVTAEGADSRHRFGEFAAVRLVHRRAQKLQSQIRANDISFYEICPKL